MGSAASGRGNVRVRGRAGVKVRGRGSGGDGGEGGSLVGTRGHLKCCCERRCGTIEGVSITDGDYNFNPKFLKFTMAS